jgi:hypothetical protein
MEILSNSPDCPWYCYHFAIRVHLVLRNELRIMRVVSRKELGIIKPAQDKTQPLRGRFARKDKRNYFCEKEMRIKVLKPSPNLGLSKKEYVYLSL